MVKIGNKSYVTIPYDEIMGIMTVNNSANRSMSKCTDLSVHGVTALLKNYIPIGSKVTASMRINGGEFDVELVVRKTLETRLGSFITSFEFINRSPKLTLNIKKHVFTELNKNDESKE